MRKGGVFTTNTLTYFRPLRGGAGVGGGGTAVMIISSVTGLVG